MPEQEIEPLYCWVVGKDFSIKKFVITEYKHIGLDTTQPEFTFSFSFSGDDVKETYSVRESNIDSFVYKKYYSFNANDKVALTNIRSSITKELDYHKKKYAKYKKFYDRLTISLEGLLDEKNN